MNEFLNPKAMSTPGAAGALTMLIANSLCANFPELAFRYVALVLSLVIGAAVVAAATVKFRERGAYWLVNSLIIFSMGVGTTNIAANVAAEKRAHSEHGTSVASAVMSFVAGPAYAQIAQPPHSPQMPGPLVVAANGTAGSTPAMDAELRERLKANEARVRELKVANRRLQKQGSSAAPDAHKTSEKQNGFFRRW